MNTVNLVRHNSSSHFEPPGHTKRRLWIDSRVHFAPPLASCSFMVQLSVPLKILTAVLRDTCALPGSSGAIFFCSVFKCCLLCR